MGRVKTSGRGSIFRRNRKSEEKLLESPAEGNVPWAVQLRILRPERRFLKQSLADIRAGSGSVIHALALHVAFRHWQRCRLLAGFALAAMTTFSEDFERTGVPVHGSYRNVVTNHTETRRCT